MSINPVTGFGARAPSSDSAGTVEAPDIDNPENEPDKLLGPGTPQSIVIGPTPPPLVIIEPPPEPQPWAVPALGGPGSTVPVGVGGPPGPRPELPPQIAPILRRPPASRQVRSSRG